MTTLAVRGYFFHILHKMEPTNRVGRYVDYSLTAIILTNCVAVALETVPTIYGEHGAIFYCDLD